MGIKMCSHETQTQIIVTAQTCVYTVATVRSVCTVWSYVCSVCTEQTVLLVPLILLGIVNVLVDTSAQNNNQSDQGPRERPD